MSTPRPRSALIVHPGLSTRLTLRRLDELNVDEVDMLTIVLIGSSESRTVRSGDITAGAGGTWVYTPRGYAAKMEGTT